MANCYFGPTVSYSATGTAPSRSCGPYTLAWRSTYRDYAISIPFGTDTVCGYLEIVWIPPDPAVPSYGNIQATGAGFALEDILNTPSANYDCTSGPDLTYTCASDCPILQQFGGTGIGVITVSGGGGGPVIGGGGDGGGGSPNGPGQGTYLPPVVAEGSEFLVFGSGFTTVTAVTVGGVPVSYSILSDTVLQITVPADGSVITGAVLITNTDGSATGPNICIYSTAAPFVGKVSC